MSLTAKLPASTLKNSSESSSYRQLRKVAESLIQRERQCTLTATSLVHELFLKLKRADSNAQFETDKIPSYSARIMKKILIDRARSRMVRQKAEGFSLPARQASRPAMHKLRAQLIELDDAIGLLSQSLPSNAELVRLHLYNEVSIEQAARELGMSRADAYRKWAFSKAWLLNKLSLDG